MSQSTTGLAYFIQAESGPIKIGLAIDAIARLAELQTGNHELLRLIGTVGGGRVAERGLHRRFAEHRIRGEWFEAAPVILAEIEALCRK